MGEDKHSQNMRAPREVKECWHGMVNSLRLLVSEIRLVRIWALDFQGLQKLHGVRWKIGEDLDNWSNRFTKKMERAEAGPGGAKKNVNSLRNLYHLVHKSASSRLYWPYSSWNAHMSRKTQRGAWRKRSKNLATSRKRFFALSSETSADQESYCPVSNEMIDHNHDEDKARACRW